MKKQQFQERVQKSTSLCMELSDEILGMKHGQSTDYDYVLSLIKDIHKNQMELLTEMYEVEVDCRVEIPQFIFQR